ncbi:MAG TPA: DUF2254 domain-containing protein [Aliidiomarina sp.]|nr:DUF2254 domain-containing protein [Aliidiomarina sp.]
MKSVIPLDRLRFLINRFRTRLWVRPLVVCLLSMAAVFIAKLADGTALGKHAPTIALESVEALLSVMASSMLVIATFSVGSMISAYASASNTATPRSFSLVLSDDVSKNALSTFVGAFIFSVVALTAFKNDYVEKAGLFILFALTVIVFAMVVVTFVCWVDSIARLGRLGSTIEKVESAALEALKRRRKAPTLGAVVKEKSKTNGEAVYASSIGYVQYIDIAAIQTWAEKNDAKVVVEALAGTFVTPDRTLAYVYTGSGAKSNVAYECVSQWFHIGQERLFEDDPRFGLVVLSEIASRALSPAVNDPGTAISIIGTMTRLFALWNEPAKEENDKSPEYDRVYVAQLSTHDMFEDAFLAIGRDGAGLVEVSLRLQKALASLAAIGDAEMKDAAIYHGQLAFKRARHALTIDEDIAAVRDAASFAKPTPSAATMEGR